jgi:hypothetical protein
VGLLVLGEQRFLMGGRLGLSLSVELKWSLLLGCNEETASPLLRMYPLARVLGDTLEHCGVGLLENLLLDPLVALRVEGGQDHHLLLGVPLRLLLLLLLLLHICLRICYECCIALVKLGVVRESSKLKSGSSSLLSGYGGAMGSGCGGSCRATGI